MAYVATRGGEKAIDQAERLYRQSIGTIDQKRITEIKNTLPYLIDRVMSEASLYEPELAALAIAQGGGDLYEAVLLLRAWRTTQPRIAIAKTIEQDKLFTIRRISAAFKDIPGGQILGPTLDYAHKILATHSLNGEPFMAQAVEKSTKPSPAFLPSLSHWQQAQGLIEAPIHHPIAAEDIPDLTREPLLFPASRAHRLQSLSRADTGGVLALGYSAMRGFGSAHPTVNELRLSEAEIIVSHPSGTQFSAGRIKISQAEVISKTKKDKLELGFSATFGWNEVKVIAAATLDLNASTESKSDAVSEEFFLYHTEAVESSGFCIHFKLPHYVTFQSSLDALRGIKRRNADGSEIREDLKRLEEELI